LPRLGFHLSIGGGLVRAVEQGRRTGCEAAQVFSRSPRMWKAKPLDSGAAEAFRRARSEAGLAPLAVHLPYLPNLASADEVLYEKSIEVLAEEMFRAEALGADFVVAHPGHGSADEPVGRSLSRVARGVLRALQAPNRTGSVRLLLENTSGQRGELGIDFYQLAEIIEQIETSAFEGPPVGVCLDTAHAWAAGYDLARPNGQDETLAELDRVLGLDRLGMIHFNDSLAEKNGRRDRHAPVGRGRIGSRGLARWLRLPELDHLAFIMETPRATEADDLINMARAKRWRGSAQGELIPMKSNKINK